MKEKEKVRNLVQSKTITTKKLLAIGLETRLETEVMLISPRLWTITLGGGRQLLWRRISSACNHTPHSERTDGHVVCLRLAEADGVQQKKKLLPHMASSIIAISWMACHLHGKDGRCGRPAPSIMSQLSVCNLLWMTTLTLARSTFRFEFGWSYYCRASEICR